jgi:hypothetical protein
MFGEIIYYWVVTDLLQVNKPEEYNWSIRDQPKKKRIRSSMEIRSGGSRWDAGTATPHGEAEITGWLYKWVNYIIGYQKRWFVLYNGLLSYYR